MLSFLEKGFSQTVPYMAEFYNIHNISVSGKKTQQQQQKKKKQFGLWHCTIDRESIHLSTCSLSLFIRLPLTDNYSLGIL